MKIAVIVSGCVETVSGTSKGRSRRMRGARNKEKGLYLLASRSSEGIRKASHQGTTEGKKRYARGRAKGPRRGNIEEKSGEDKPIKKEKTGAKNGS